MLSPTKLSLLLALGAAAVPFDGPSETIAAIDLLGRTPMPTSSPQLPEQIFRRQAESDDGICGYISGISSRSVSCTVGMCMYNAAINWFGCCTGTLSADCKIATSCVASASINSCIDNPDCINNPRVTACTASDRPYCASLSSVASEGTVTHVVCAPTASKVELLPLVATVSGALNGTASTSARVSAASVSLSSSRSSSSSSSAALLSSSAALSSSRASVSSAAASSARSSASAAAPTSSSGSSPGSMMAAQAMLGAGGLTGLFALFL